MRKKMIDVSVEDYLVFVRGYRPKLLRDVTHICEPPQERFCDDSGDEVWPEFVVADCKLVDDGYGDVDPRPKNARPTPWWREGCRIREDWLA